MAVHIPGLIMMFLFYLLVLGIGIWASIKSKKMEKNTHSGQLEVSFLANRKVGLVMGVFTMTATWVGGAFIIGVAESVYDPTKGLIWALIPLQMSVSFIIGGLFFAKPMRENNYITMMDPFQRKYGKTLTAVLAIIPFISELMWVPVTLISLGVTISVFSDLPLSLCIWISAAVAITYTLLGGLYSVVFTDIVQLSLVFCSLWLCTPFVLASDVYTDITKTAFNNTSQASWIGHIEPDDVWRWIDNFLAMSVGNLAFQDFHQRILSSSSTSTARMICFIAAGVVLIIGIPPVLIGAVAASTDWNSTTYGSPSPYERGEAAMVLPIILLHLTPTTRKKCGHSTFLTKLRFAFLLLQASHRELQWVIRVSIAVVGLVGTSLTHLNSSILAFWILSSDLTYTITLPQLICILFIRVSNGYGAITGYVVSFVMRVLCGEPVFNLPVILRFPGCTWKDGVYIQHWPFKTICMLSALISIVMISYVASFLFNKDILPERWDVFKVKHQKTPTDGAKGCDGEKAAATNENEPMLETDC
ncbi:high-affinity choline transporter 1-like [Pseudochaenichthys georgianus]|uniref:high-affinity choline transporter 1-like n=1 Tax=Pseudochaenichthys georgianus TaxID=52239 RepID=UPI00146BDB80|nr:high-affinity choline transporter 1-like [Pseudochaenichthys georgianus]